MTLDITQATVDCVPIQLFTEQQLARATEYCMRTLLDIHSAETQVNPLRHFIGGSIGINGRGRDIDVVILIKTSPDQLAADDIEIDSSWNKGGSDDMSTDNSWASWKKMCDDLPVNMILVSDPDSFDKFRIANNVARYIWVRYGDVDRAARVAIHRLIMSTGFTPGTADMDIPRGAV